MSASALHKIKPVKELEINTFKSLEQNFCPPNVISDKSNCGKALKSEPERHHDESNSESSRIKWSRVGSGATIWGDEALLVATSREPILANFRAHFREHYPTADIVGEAAYSCEFINNRVDDAWREGDGRSLLRSSKIYPLQTLCGSRDGEKGLAGLCVFWIHVKQMNTN